MIGRNESAYQGESGEGEVLTPQEVEDLKRQCREYCEDPDPYCTLNIGQMTLSKIKDAFAVLKNLVIEARASAPSSSASSQMEEKSGLADEAAQKQIKELRSCLLQRDQVCAGHSYLI